MPQTPDWSLGDKYLIQEAPLLELLIKKYSPCTLVPEKEDRYFATLLRGLISQQLPPAVVNDLCRKISLLVGEVTPENIIATTDKELLAQGLVQQKIDYLRNFSHMVANGQVTLDKFEEMSDTEISKQLLLVKGLGQWTIEMFLLLALCRTDVVPTADHNFAKALQTLLNLPALPKRGEINKLTAAWRPWRSLAVWYLWQASDDLAKREALAKNKK
jgi:DNA-3-methyladenine glycosylase II